MTIQQLLKEQRELGDAIKAKRTRYNNSLLESRTLSYVRERINSLQASWEQFLKNDQDIKDSTEIDGGNQYFSTNYFTTIGTVYSEYLGELERAKKEMEDWMAPPPPEANGNGQANSNPIENILGGDQQAPIGTPIDLGHMFRNFGVSMNNLQNVSGLSNNPAPSNKFHNHKKLMNELSNLMDNYDDLQKDDPQNDDAAKFAQKFITEKWELINNMHKNFAQAYPDYDMQQHSALEQRVQPILWQHQNNSGYLGALGPTGKKESSAKLPKLSVPIYSGDFVQYKSFKQLFNKMVGSRSDLDNVEKLAYLKGQLSGEALKLISALPVENGSYATAWKTLDARFDNQHRIMIKLIGRITGIKPMRTPSSEELKDVVDEITEAVSSLKNMGKTIGDIGNNFLYYHTEQKIHPTVVRIYENGITTPGKQRTYEELMEFLQCRVQNSTAKKPHHEKRPTDFAWKSNGVQENKKPVSGTSLISTKGSTGTSSCDCKVKHPLQQCPKFMELSPIERYNKCRSLSRCINCLRSGHSSEKCKSSPCKKCNKKHNKLLHFEKQQPQKALISATIKNENFRHVFLATALVDVMDKYGNKVQIRALLDSGSQLNMMSEKVYRKLGIKHQTACMKISGIGSSATESRKRAIIQINSKHSGFETSLEVFIIKNMTTCQPTTEINTKGWKIPKNISLADPHFNMPASVDVIIGGEIFFKLMSIGMISIGKSLPDLQNTVFGWVVIGKLLGLEQQEAFVGISTEQLDNQLTKFWNIEEKFQPLKRFTQLEQDCEKFYADTTKRDQRNGRFIVKLQFLKEPEVLGRSEEMAIRRFLYLERKFAKDPELKNDYLNFMREYEELDHMMPIKRKSLGDNFYMIPHHGVRNPSSSTTKFRVVFDASAKTTSNISLNEILANGPMLQEDLFSIMVRFRTHRYVFSADITKMYRKVMVDPDDMKWQVIVWREEPHLPLKYYKLKTLTYGTTCASYLAIKSLQQLADENQEKYPRASAIAKKDFNVDDVMTGTDDLHYAVVMQQELIEMCAKADFRLHKWCANHPLLLENIPKKNQEISLDINADKTETKALGMKWIPSTDKFMLNYQQREHKKITKRTVLSETAQLFDPLGLVNPVIVMAKIFLQELWALKLDWDASLPMDLHTKWTEFRQELIKLNNISIPRHMVVENPYDIQLHVFSDASTRAYGAVAYLRSETESGQVQVNLVCSKSRVAPVSATTLSRLELCAGVVMVDLAKKLEAIMELSISSLTYWTDSELVLSWIYTDGTYKTFVANRVASIKRNTNADDWKYINTKLNPADLISRGVLPDKLINSELWWHGPEFLRKPKSEWPINKPAFVREPAEERSIKTILTTFEDGEHFIERINHRNSIQVLQRVVAYIMRIKPKSSTELQAVTDSVESYNKLYSKNLTPEELKKAEICIIKYCQKKSFAAEIASISKGDAHKTKFSNLVPIMDQDGIIRVGGRLQAANIPFDQRHPILLPKDHLITKLIMERIHRENMHAGPQALLAITRQKYWPDHGKTLASTIVKNCMLCTKSKPRLMEQIMGNLPAERVNQARPFIHVGMDFAGPITIHYKIRGKRPTKAYICIFVCFSTKAVHIEAAADLTTEAFISCLKRFIARRGLPKRIFCDNATNFTGANNQLQELKELMDQPNHQEQVIRYCSDHQIEWKFIPPRSPHFGGLHEAAVKSAKYHLKKVLHSVDVTYDELITILAEIEAILNSRPLTPMSNDPNDLQPLTAGHFLIGMPMNCIDDRNLPQTSKTIMWTKIRQLKAEFWQRWKKEYLAELQQRNKWTKERENVKIGTLVIIKENNVPSLHWKMARVINTIKDSFGKVRVVILRTETGELKRAIHEIAPLPLEPEINEPDPEQSTPQVRMNTPSQRKKLNPAAPVFTPKNQHAKSSPAAKYKNKNSSKNIPEFEPRITRSKSRKTVSYSTTMMLIISFFMAIIIGISGEKCDVVSFNTNPGLYFEESGQVSLTNNEWNIICYIQLNDYWNQGMTIKKLTDRLDDMCPHLDPTEYCDVSRKQLRIQLNIIQNKNELIQGFSLTRKRREVLPKTYLTQENILDKNEADQLEKLIEKSLDKQMKNTIQKMVLTSPTNKQLGWSKLLKNGLNMLTGIAKEEIVQKTLLRKKRGWANVIGSGLKVVTGVLDDDDAKAFEEKINNLDIEQQHLHQLLENQTTAQDITRNIIRKEETGISKQLIRLENELDTLRDKNSLDKADIFNAIALQAVSLINNYQDTQNTLIDMFTNAHHGKISPSIITPIQLRQHMITIASNISKELMIPGDDLRENIARLYATLTAKVRVTKTRVIIKITMPLLQREFYKLYHMIPVPFMTTIPT